jgi:hypothetical protein
VASWTNDIGTR